MCLADASICYSRTAIDYRNAAFSVERVLEWGSRPVLSMGSKLLAFTESDTRDSQAYELNLESKEVRCLTCHLGMDGLVTRDYILPYGNYVVLARRGLGRGQPFNFRAVRSISGQQELYWLSSTNDGVLVPLDAPAFGDLAIFLRRGWREHQNCLDRDCKQQVLPAH